MDLNDAGGEWDDPHLVCAQSLNEHVDTHRLGFHDVFALRMKGHDAFNKSFFFNTMANSLFNAHADLTPVHSCFSGLALYDTRALQLCDYDDKTTDCEHISFHNCMRRTGLGRMYIDPLLSTYYRDHRTRPIGNVCVRTSDPRSVARRTLV